MVASGHKLKSVSFVVVLGSTMPLVGVCVLAVGTQLTYCPSDTVECIYCGMCGEVQEAVFMWLPCRFPCPRLLLLRAGPYWAG